jgi:cytochrome c6
MNLPTMKSLLLHTVAFVALTTSVALVANRAAAQDAAAGATVYKSKCATCHGPDGAGTAMGKSLKVLDLRSSEVQSRSDAELIQVVSEGKNNMPGFKGNITDDEIQSVVKFVRTLAKGDSAPKKK